MYLFYLNKHDIIYLCKLIFLPSLMLILFLLESSTFYFALCFYFSSVISVALLFNNELANLLHDFDIGIQTFYKQIFVNKIIYQNQLIIRIDF